jgi:hypothetical protein
MPLLKMFSRSTHGTSRVVRMMIIGDATTWSITSDDYRGVIDVHNILQYRRGLSRRGVSDDDDEENVFETLTPALRRWKAGPQSQEC